MFFDSQRPRHQIVSLSPENPISLYLQASASCCGFIFGCVCSTLMAGSRRCSCLEMAGDSLQLI
jgi:hypothetical protein